MGPHELRDRSSSEVERAPNTLQDLTEVQIDVEPKDPHHQKKLSPLILLDLLWQVKD
jgi:hypothetical protein